jgi:hypothetical protein
LLDRRSLESSFGPTELWPVDVATRCESLLVNNEGVDICSQRG